MTARRDLQRRLAGLTDIRGIMHSMRSLAFMEARKLERLLASQRQQVATIEQAARDLLQHHPDLLPAGPPPPAIELLVGSERGFCGDFNEALLADADSSAAAEQVPRQRILVGRRLQLQAGDDARVLAVVPGADVAEDVEGVLAAILAALGQSPGGTGSWSLVARYHAGEGGAPAGRALLPPWRAVPRDAELRPWPPLLNLDPRRMFRELVDHYLFAVLHEILMASLQAENQRRARHLDGAVNRLDERIEELRHRGQQLRQEEITEEIEVILLSATGGRRARPNPA